MYTSGETFFLVFDHLILKLIKFMKRKQRTKEITSVKALVTINICEFWLLFQRLLIIKEIISNTPQSFLLDVLTPDLEVGPEILIFSNPLFGFWISD